MNHMKLTYDSQPDKLKTSAYIRVAGTRFERGLHMKIGELSRILDMPKDTIRFYEKNGMLTYEVNQENGYHEYTIWDMINLTECLSCRGLGISIKKTLDLKRNGTIHDIVAEYEDISRQIEKDLQDKQAVKDYLQGCINEMKTASYNLGRFWFETRPQYLFYPYLYRDQTNYLMFDTIDYSIYHAWNKSLPVVRGSMIISQENLSAYPVLAKDIWCLMIEQKYAEMQKLPIDASCVTLPAHIGLCTIVDIGERGGMDISIFMPMLNYLKNTPYEPDLQYAYGYLLNRSWKDGKLQRYIKLIIPVQDTDKKCAAINS